MALLAEVVELVIGVDTHKDTHTEAVVAAATGVVVTQVTVPATPAGYQQLPKLADQHCRRRVWAIDSTGGYGAGLTRSSPPITSRSWSWIGPSGPPDGTAPSPIPWMPAGPPARRWAATSWPSHERPDCGRRCRCGWPLAVQRSRPPATPNANCTRWWSPHPRPCGNGSGPARPASWWLPAPVAGPDQLGR